MILMDISLPDISGIEAFKEIRHKDKTSFIPIIALTATVISTDITFILETGFDAFIAKPIIEDKFFKTIEGVLYE